MKREQSTGAFLSAVFVDYDNIYLSLKRKSEEAAKRFAKDALTWIRAIENGSLITPTNGLLSEGTRRIVMNRCYGNPVPRRNQNDNSTDMNSFPFTRHHFLRAGFEIIDCPPLTAQLKNSSDIRMVMDLRDYLTHPTYFDEFVILSGDADFTPVLHRLRAHARRTVIFANDHTAAPYTAICDGEIRESDLISLLLEGKIKSEPDASGKIEAINPQLARQEIMADVIAAVRSSPSPVPLEALADRAVRQVGHEKTIGTSWGGAGGFRELLAQELPADLRLSGEPPYIVIDTTRHIAVQPQPARLQAQPPPPAAAKVQVKAPQARPMVQAQLAAQPQVAQVQAAPVQAAIPQRQIPTPQPVIAPTVHAAQLAPAQPAAQWQEPFQAVAEAFYGSEQSYDAGPALEVPQTQLQPAPRQVAPQAQPIGQVPMQRGAQGQAQQIAFAAERDPGGRQPSIAPAVSPPAQRMKASAIGTQNQQQPAPAPTAPVAAAPPRARVSEPASNTPRAAGPAAGGAAHYQAPTAPVPTSSAPATPQQPGPRGNETASAIHQSIARIHEACQAPPLAPPEYRALFEAMAQEINENGLIGAQTISNIAQRVLERGIEVRRDDVRFVLEVVSEADPWFEQGASANLFAGRFRNFVVARCRSQGLNLSADELDLIEAWFAGGGQIPQRPQAEAQPAQPLVPQPQSRFSVQQQPPPPEPRNWSLEEGRRHVAEQRQVASQVEVPADDFPRIVRTRLRG